MKLPIDRLRLSAIDERDREVRETVRGYALARRRLTEWSPQHGARHERYELTTKKFFLEQVKEMRCGH